MADPLSEIHKYPLPAYNYRVTIDGTSVSFSEVSGIQVELDHQTYRHGLSFQEGEDIAVLKIDKFVTVTFKKGTVRGASFLYDWLDKKDLRMVEVSLCDENGDPVSSWRLAKVVPTKLQAPTFDANGRDVSIETLEVMAAGITFHNH